MSKTDYSAHFEELQKKGNWNLNMKGSTNQYSFLATPGMFARKNLLYLESIVVNHLSPPGFFIERKDYNSYQLMYTISGTGELIYENKEYRLEAGDCILIDCTKEHSLRTAIGAEQWFRNGLQFNGTIMPSLYREAESFGAIVTKIEDRGKVCALYDNIAQACITRLPSADYLINQYLVELVTMILLNNRATSTKQLSSVIRKVCEYIDTHFSSIESIETVARACGISKYHLCREFRNQTGSTLMEYLRGVRINYAKQLLLNSSLPVADIAIKAGFSNENYEDQKLADFISSSSCHYSYFYYLHEGNVFQ